jgi:hypothetical protein
MPEDEEILPTAEALGGCAVAPDQAGVDTHSLVLDSDDSPVA